MTPTHTRQLTEGAIFARDFKIVRLLAEGGMGSVYVAQQLSTGRERALKLMLPDLVRGPELRARFEEEARIASQIDSDHVVEVLGAGVDEATGQPFIAMELLQGRTLEERLQTQGPLSAAELVEVFGQLGHALGLAHNKGIVHRDLKPENIFLAQARRKGVSFTAKVLDFGIAKIIAEGATAKTGQIGTPLYMAPEQFKGRGITPATDVWALGLIAFKALTGVPYWKSAQAADSSPMEVMEEVGFEPIEPASVRARALGCEGAIPEGFDLWFSRCVERNVPRRFPNAADSVAALDELLGTGEQGLEVQAFTPTPSQRTQLGPPSPAALVRPTEMTPPSTPCTESAPDTPEGAVIPPVPPRRTNSPPVKRGLVFGVLAGFAMLAGGGALVQSRSSSSSAEPPSSNEPDNPASSGSGSVSRLEAECQKGKPASCSSAGKIFRDGKGVPRDPAKAVSLYQKACDEGDLEGCDEIGDMYRDGEGIPPDEIKAVMLYNKSCDGGYLMACFDLGAMLKAGKGLRKDEGKAASLFQKACDGGNGPACYELGDAHRNGMGVPRDEAKALVLFQKAMSLHQTACDADDLAGCLRLGYMYEGGNGVAKDEAKAASLFQKACDGNYMRGCGWYGYMHEWGKGVPKDEVKAASLYQKACDGNYMKGCERLGDIYFHGKGVPKDEEKGVSLFQKACDGNDMNGCVILGHMYSGGKGVPKDEGTAASLYQKACDSGEMQGCLNLGDLRLSGRGMPKDVTKARFLFQKACDGGNKDACAQIKRMHQ